MHPADPTNNSADPRSHGHCEGPARPLALSCPPHGPPVQPGTCPAHSGPVEAQTPPSQGHHGGHKGVNPSRVSPAVSGSVSRGGVLWPPLVLSSGWLMGVGSLLTPLRFWGACWLGLQSWPGVHSPSKYPLEGVLVPLATQTRGARTPRHDWSGPLWGSVDILGVSWRLCGVRAPRSTGVPAPNWGSCPVPTLSCIPSLGSHLPSAKPASPSK